MNDQPEVFRAAMASLLAQQSVDLRVVTLGDGVEFSRLRKIHVDDQIIPAVPVEVIGTPLALGQAGLHAGSRAALSKVSECRVSR